MFVLVEYRCHFICDSRIMEPRGLIVIDSELKLWSISPMVKIGVFINPQSLQKSGTCWENRNAPDFSNLSLTQAVGDVFNFEF